MGRRWRNVVHGTRLVIHAWICSSEGSAGGGGWWSSAIGQYRGLVDWSGVSSSDECSESLSAVAMRMSYVVLVVGGGRWMGSVR
jgi:hypothetical protein